MEETIGSRLRRQRRRAISSIVDGSWAGLSLFGGALPLTTPSRHGVERVRNVAYLPSGRAEHLLDIYRPMGVEGPLPAVLYIHGGGFRALSKNSHWLMGLAFARRGFVVFNVNYRLAPKFPFPAAAEDVCAAYCWLVDNAERYGADPQRLVVAGESAGANLTAVLAIASAYRRPEPWAAQIFESRVRPRVALPACGLFQVSNPGRFGGGPWPFIFTDILDNVADIYLPSGRADEAASLADPLLILERGEKPEKPLPPFFLPVGTYDPLIDDTRRMETALQGLQVPCQARYYKGELHAFHALIWRRVARECWQEMMAFTATHLSDPPPGSEG